MSKQNSWISEKIKNQKSIFGGKKQTRGQTRDSLSPLSPARAKRPRPWIGIFQPHEINSDNA